MSSGSGSDDNTPSGEQGQRSEAEVCAEDQRKYPKCFHQTQSNTRCASNKEGKMVCDTIRQVSRICPGSRAPALIYEEKQSGVEHTSLLGSLFFGNSSKKDRNPMARDISAEGAKDLDDLAESLLDAFKPFVESTRDGMRNRKQEQQPRSRHSPFHQPPPSQAQELPPQASAPLDEFDRQLSEALTGGKCGDTTKEID